MLIHPDGNAPSNKLYPSQCLHSVQVMAFPLHGESEGFLSLPPKLISKPGEAFSDSSIESWDKVRPGSDSVRWYRELGLANGGRILAETLG